MRAVDGRPSIPASFVGFDPAEVESSIPERFALQVRRAPERLAVADRIHRWSYRELNAAANRVAHALLDRRAELGDVVVLLMEQGAPCASAILGALKAGKIFSPLDLSTPETQLTGIIERTGARAVVATRRTRSLATRVAPPGTGVLDLGEIEDAHIADPPLCVSPDAPACIFFTSGSTGAPKGVVDSHRNVLHNVMRYTNSLRISETDRMSLLQAPSFSGSASNVFGALLNGASLFPYEVGEEVGSLSDWIEREEITIYHSVPSLFRVAASGGGPFPSLRVVRLEGDQASHGDLELFERCCDPACTLVNGLGSTECGLVRQYFVDRDRVVPPGRVPVGYPVADMDVQVVDEDRTPLPRGEVGEIAVRSRYLALGYWQDADETRRCFVSEEADPSLRTYLTGDLGRIHDDGCLELIGRKTLQPRIRGRLVDAGAVERSLLELHDLKEVAVHALEDVYGERKLVAYCVAEAGRLPSIAQMREHLAGRMPDFMVPSTYVALDALPLSSEGKLDRLRLPAPGSLRPETGSRFEPPRTELECRLAAIWEGVLGVEPVGVHDDFLDLGGDSLSAMRLIEGIGRELGHRVPMTSLLEQSTIRDLAELLEGKGKLVGLRRTWGSIVGLKEGGDEAPLYCLPGASGSPIRLRRLAVALGSGRACYGYAFRARDDRPPEDIAVEEIAGDFVAQARRIQPAGPYALCGYSWGAILAFEAARQLLASGEAVDFLGIFDEPAPIDPSVSVRGIAFLRRMSQLGWGDRSAYLRAALTARFPRAAPTAPAPPPPEPTDAEHWLEGEWNRARRIAYLTTNRYRPAAYPGTLTLFAGPKRPLEDSAVRFEPDLGWSRLVSGRVDVIRIDGAHDDLLDEPHVSSLGAKVGRQLARGPNQLPR